MNCDSCGKEFEKQESLNQHMLDKHGIGVTKHELKERKKSERAEAYASELQKKEKRKRIKKTGIIIAIVIAVIGIVYAAVSFVPKNTDVPGPLGSTHIHQDFKVIVEGRQLDFSLPRYQVKSQYVHVEGGDGDVIHVHATGVTIGFFLRSLGFKFNSTCLVLDSGTQYCNTNDKTLKFYVNENPNSEFEKYLLGINDKILISYGNEDQEEIERQLTFITNKAPITTTHRG
ncbi:MAG: hypothetical protein HY514_05120 [Candidatus Aenigmarchaeota archaeon]|nr:hypothetical protein [Candidatus Aenigmarchaeota archaeon]